MIDLRVDVLTLLFICNSLTLPTLIVLIDLKTTKAWMRERARRGEDPSAKEHTKRLARLVQEHGIDGGWLRYAPLEWILFFVAISAIAFPATVVLGIPGLLSWDAILLIAFYFVTMRTNLIAIRKERAVSAEKTET